MSWEVLQGDCRDVLPTLPEKSVNCCVTSPPYFGLRSYFPDGVRLRDGLSEEEKQRIVAELERMNVRPVDHTTK